MATNQPHPSDVPTQQPSHHNPTQAPFASNAQPAPTDYQQHQQQHHNPTTERLKELGLAPTVASMDQQGPTHATQGQVMTTNTQIVHNQPPRTQIPQPERCDTTIPKKHSQAPLFAPHGRATPPRSKPPTPPPPKHRMSPANGLMYTPNKTEEDGQSNATGTTWQIRKNRLARFVWEPKIITPARSNHPSQDESRSMYSDDDGMTNEDDFDMSLDDDINQLSEKDKALLQNWECDHSKKLYGQSLALAGILFEHQRGSMMKGIKPTYETYQSGTVTPSPASWETTWGSTQNKEKDYWEAQYHNQQHQQRRSESTTPFYDYNARNTTPVEEYQVPDPLQSDHHREEPKQRHRRNTATAVHSRLSLPNKPLPHSASQVSAPPRAITPPPGSKWTHSSPKLHPSVSASAALYRHGGSVYGTDNGGHGSKMQAPNSPVTDVNAALRSSYTATPSSSLHHSATASSINTKTFGSEHAPTPPPRVLKNTTNKSTKHSSSRRHSGGPTSTMSHPSFTTTNCNSNSRQTAQYQHPLSPESLCTDIESAVGATTVTPSTTNAAMDNPPQAPFQHRELQAYLQNGTYFWMGTSKRFGRKQDYTERFFKVAKDQLMWARAGKAFSHAMPLSSITHIAYTEDDKFHYIDLHSNNKKVNMRTGTRAKWLAWVHGLALYCRDAQISGSPPLQPVSG
eukprot:TRINITY_DN64614_c0_g2_i1.p1 TRINITY_DN64614_c0_g2~~TRINITY_DN64614_c0_g2_i1.p1  ORF type:complete len:801 (+),score=83.74 TRINITY_DN64614_c0_g2_i1:358-2403(+)